MSSARVAFPEAGPEWLTFDCNGTLIQWDEGLVAAVETVLGRQAQVKVDVATLVRVYANHAVARDFGLCCIRIDRRTGRKLLPDYTPDRTFDRLDRVPEFFRSIGWG